MTRETCATCRFFEAADAGSNWPGSCHLKPPTFTNGNEFVGWYWAAVGPDSWCGEHQPVASAPAASDDYTRAAVELAEAHAHLCDAECRLGVSADGDFGDVDERRNEVSWAGHARDRAECAFLRLYRERHDAG